MEGTFTVGEPITEEEALARAAEMRLHPNSPSDPSAIIDSRRKEADMAQLIVRNLDDDLVARLKRWAAELGCSAEEAHREILRRALRDDDAFAQRLLEIPDVGLDTDFERPREMPRDVEL